MTVQTNLRVLNKSRKPAELGEIFAMQLPNEKYLFGRVILADVPRERAPMPGANLIYVYDQQSELIRPDHSQLTPGRLLIPPVWTNNLPWTKGYFRTVEVSPLSESDVLRQHCFFNASLRPNTPGTFVDELGRKRSSRSEPCGEWGLASYRWIDDHVSDAVGIPRVPEDGQSK